MVNVTDANASESLKEASLEAIGYICQDIVCCFTLLLNYIFHFSPQNLNFNLNTWMFSFQR